MNIEPIVTALKSTLRAYYQGLVVKLNAIVTVVSDHVNNTNNPHRVRKEDVELGHVENYPPSTKQQALDGVNNTSYLTPIRGREQAETVADEVASAFEEARADLES